MFLRNHVQTFMKGNFVVSMFLSHVTSVGVDSYISQVDNNKSIGPYYIPVPLLKILKTPIPPFLPSITNDSLLCGIFSSKLKLTQAAAVFKKGSKQEPISLLPILVKLLKKLCLSAFMVILSIKTFFIHFNLALSKSAQLIMQITESICTSICNNGFGCGIFSYLKKAFDHSILLSKLNHYGRRSKAYDWFQSYLSNTEQFVCINGHKSDSLSITCGIPQGSFIGPLLFLLYINDLPNTSKLRSFQLFADDTNIHCSSNDPILN